MSKVQILHALSVGILDYLIFFGASSLLAFCAREKRPSVEQPKDDFPLRKSSTSQNSNFHLHFLPNFRTNRLRHKVTNIYSYSRNSANERVVYGMKTKTRSHKSFLITLPSCSFRFLAPQLKTKII